jgi:hypothetical protein
MSFLNRSSFATLQDAYGIQEFEQRPVEEYTVQEPSKTPITVMESFTEEGPNKQCNCSKRSYFNEFLNIVLILLLLYIAVFKPQI